MNLKERNNLINKMIDTHTENVTRTSEAAREYLVSMGVYDIHGNLTPEYGGANIDELFDKSFAPNIIKLSKIKSFFKNLLK